MAAHNVFVDRPGPALSPPHQHVLGSAEVGPASSRVDALDALRVLGMIAVVAAHAAAPYMRLRVRRLFWAVQERGPDLTCDLIFWWTVATALPLFFMMGGYAAEAVRSRRGRLGLVRDRWRRIVVPFLVAIPAILYPTRAIWAYGWYVMGVSSPSQFLSFVPPPVYLARANNTGAAHLWFLQYMAAMLVVAVLLWPRVDRLLARVPARLVTAFWTPFLLVIPTTLILWANRAIVPLDSIMDMRNELMINPVRWLHHGLFFLVGIALYRARDTWSVLAARGPFLLVLAALAFVARAVLLRRDGMGPPLAGLDAALLAATGAMYGWLGLFGWLGTALRYLKRTGPIMAYLAESSYWVYLIHFPITGLIQVNMYGYAWPSWVKFLVALAASLGLGLLTFEAGVRRTRIGRWLNGSYGAVDRKETARPLPIRNKRARVAVAR